MMETKSPVRIGVFIEWLRDGYSDPILDEIVKAAEERGVQIRCFVGGLDAPDYPIPTRHIPAVYASPACIDGAVVVSMGNFTSSNDVERYFDRLKDIPLCSVAVQWSGYPSVEVDNETGVRSGVRHLIRTHGRRRIACIRGPENSSEADKRFMAYREVLAEFGLPFDASLVATGHYIPPQGIEAVRILLDERKVTFDAVVAANDAMALGALEELERRGLRVPEDVSLLGFDDIDEGRHARPPLSTVRQPVRLHGRKALEVVLAQIAGQKVPRVTRIDSNLVLRKSCGCASSRGRSISSAAPPPQALPNTLETWASSAAAMFIDFLGAENAPELEAEFRGRLLEVARAGQSPAFLDLIEAEFGRLGNGRADLLLALPLVDTKRRELAEVGGKKVEQANLDRLLSDVSVIVSELAERGQAQLRYQAEIQINRLLRMNEALQQTMDFGHMAEVIAKELPSLGIRACYVCIWEGQEVPTEWARLVMACDAGAVRGLSPEDLRFPAIEILPQGYGTFSEDAPWLICPMLRREATIAGYVVIVRGTAEAFVYDGLVDQISSNFKRLQLTRQIVRQVELREAAERQRMEREMQIATRIQTGILPRRVSIEGLEISCSMRPATEVGGDYYDVVAVENGCWLGIGDVAGHGLPTGLVMLMCQSVIGGLIRNQPDAEPARLLSVANQLLYDNIRRRMQQDEHITLALFRFSVDGRLSFAGAHDPPLLLRSKSTVVERLPLLGMWAGIIEDIASMTTPESVLLEPGDVLVFYTDGLTEARNAKGEPFGETRLIEALIACRDGTVDEIRQGMLERVYDWMKLQDDDMTIVVARYCELA